MAREPRVCILDYGSGNVRSVLNMFGACAPGAAVSNDPAAIREATHLVLPGVGAFGASMEKMKQNIPLEALEREVRVAKKPFLGICVGMQVLAERGFEFGEHRGLGWIEGDVVKLDSGSLALPHVGWNNVRFENSSAFASAFDEEPDFYFTHSFVFKPRRPEEAAGITQYGESFASIVQKENIHGVQFHPEKSQKAGRALVERFLAL